MNPVESAITAEVEDRFRAASQALAERFPDSGMPPLNLPAQPARTPPLRGLRKLRELGGRTRNWLIPLAAAAAVMAVIAASLAIARPLTREANGPLPGRPLNGPEGTPPYFVTSTNNSRATVIVRYTATGQTVATVKPPRPYTSLVVLAGSADDRSFLLGERSHGDRFNFALLQIATGNSQVKLTQLRIYVASVILCSLALSPDGSKVAVAYSSARANSHPKRFTLNIRIYDLRTGASRSWSGTQQTAGPSCGFDEKVLATWGSDRILGYSWASSTGHTLYYSRLDTTAPGGHLPTGGLQLPGSTLQAVLTANGSVATANAAGGITVVMQSTAPSGAVASGIASMGPSYPGQQFRQTILWVNPAGTVFIAQERTAKAQIAVIGAGRYIPLPIHIDGQPVVW